jgi:hypothetical protein
MLVGWGGEELRSTLTLYTDAYIVRGSLITRQRRLLDVLNTADEDFLVLMDVSFERFGGGGGTRTAAYAQVNLGAVLFAVAETTVEPVPELRTPKVPESALISIPPFEITGRIHLLPERELREALQELTGRFLPVTGATYGSETVGEAPQSAPMLAVNHARAQIWSPFSAAPTGRVERESEAPGGTEALDGGQAAANVFNPLGLSAQDIEREEPRLEG